MSETWGFKPNVQLVPGQGTHTVLGGPPVDAAALSKKLFFQFCGVRLSEGIRMDILESP